MVIPGWTVVREIPPEVMMGIITGKYKVWGGVIRWAAGTEHAGQIVRHLVASPLNPLSGAVSGLNLISGIIANVQLEQVKAATRQIQEIAQFNTYQLFQLSGQVNSLSQMTQQVLQIATGTAILSGLNLAVSCVGFAVINNRLNAIDNRLQEIQKDVKEIKSFLETSERAQLFYALKQLLKVDDNIPVEHRHTILHDSRKKLGEINMRYQELLSQSNTIEIAMANEEYFSLTALAHARCTAELGMLDSAYEEILEMNIFWQAQARRIAKEVLIGEYPQRFIATDFVDDVPTRELIQWFDFAFKEEKGLIWIDDLRRKIKEPWYEKSWFTGSDETKSKTEQNFDFFGSVGNMFGGMTEQIKENLESGKGLNKNIGVGLEKEKTLVIPALRKLMARSEVFEGYVSQYELLKHYQMKPSEFEKGVAALPESSAVNGYFILEPAFELTGF
ncbi:MAG: hypothetical protein VKK42_23560 [Lyngbya sp.]|nr:hypothetical protein [Lyngbya sp.]